MAENPSNRDGAPRNSPFWERLYQLFQRRVRDEGYEDRPRRRGIAITTSIVVSSLLWFTLTMREMHTKIIQMPTEVINVPENQSLSQLPPDAVRVQVVGDGWSLLRLRLRPPTIRINATQNDVAVRDAIPEMLPKNVDVQSVSPSTVNLWKERRITRKVPISLRAEIETPRTHDLIDPPTLLPDSVEISGAASVVGDIDEWPTIRRTFEEVRDTLEARVLLSDTLSGLVSKNLEAVTVRAISKHFTEATLEIDVTVQGQPSSRQLVSLEPSTIEVRFNVVSDQYQEAMNAMDFYATVSYDQIRGDTTGQVRPDVHVPEGIVLRDVRWSPTRLAYYERID